MIELMCVDLFRECNVDEPNALLSSARGNTSLESAVSLTKSIRWEIQSLGQRLAAAATAEETKQRKGSKAQASAQHEWELKEIVRAIRKLLTRIEDAVPLINLAITASGASLSSNLPSTVSPSRLLQASTFLTAGDSQYGANNSSYVQIGPSFILSMYMLFMGHVRPQNEEDVRESTWKEVIHKAVVRLMRVPIKALYRIPGTTPSSNGSTTAGTMEDTYLTTGPEAEVRPDEYAYQLVIVEDLDDDRVHTFEDDEPQPEPYEDIPNAGIREVVPIHELSKIFYADTGKILNIGSEGETNSPVLLLKRDTNAVPPRRMMDRNCEHDSLGDSVLESIEPNGHENDQALTISRERGERALSPVSTPFGEQQLIHTRDPWCLPPDLDPEWIAFEVYTESEDSEDESEAESSLTKPSAPSRATSVEPQTLSALSRLSISAPTTPSPPPHPPTPQTEQQIRPALPPIRTSLSLLETLLRLLSLQQFQQTPHLSIPDELLTFFLSESASTGAASNDVQERKRLREEARRHVGFDPYDESPIKRRGEDYQYHGGREGTPSQQWNGTHTGDNSYERYSSPVRDHSPRYEDEGYDTYRSQRSPLPVTPRETTPQTPPLLLTNRSRSGTPYRGSDSPSEWRAAPPRRWTDGRSVLRPGAADPGRKGSPLARPATGTTDEGIGTSPLSTEEREKE